MKELEFKINAYGKRSDLPVVIYPLKKDGTRYKKPFLIQPCGNEKYQEDVLERVQSLNPNKMFELA